MGLSIADLIVIVIYTLVMIGIGYWSMRLIKSQEDYFMGGRTFGKVLQIFAMFGSGTSTESPVGTARNTFVGGFSGIWTSLNYLFATPFYWFIGLWYRRYRMMTMGDFSRSDTRAAPWRLYTPSSALSFLSHGCRSAFPPLLKPSWP